MAPYFPVAVSRSDGVLEATTKTGSKELNQPTADQLKEEAVQGKVDCYRRLDHDEPKAVDWRRKVGGMLMHHLGGRDHSGIPGILNLCAQANLCLARPKLYP